MSWMPSWMGAPATALTEEERLKSVGATTHSPSKKRLPIGGEAALKERRDSGEEEDVLVGVKNEKGTRSFQDIVRHLGGVTALQRISTPVEGGAEASEDAVNEQLREEFASDVVRLKARFTETKRGFLDPRSPMMQYWDMTTGFCLLFTAFVTPFEVGIGLTTKIDALFIVNQVVNLVFILDIIFQFFLPVPDVRHDAPSGELVRDHGFIAKKYIKGWFLLDVVSVRTISRTAAAAQQPPAHSPPSFLPPHLQVLPFDVMMIIMPDIFSMGPMARSFKLIRIMRLIKLARVLRASRIIQR